MSYLTVATIGSYNTTIVNNFGPAQVMQRSGNKWVDLTYNLPDVGVYWITAIAYADRHLIISAQSRTSSAFNGIWCLPLRQKAWFQPAWASELSGNGSYATFHSYGGKFYTVGQQVTRRSTVTGSTELLVSGRFPTICSLITTHSGGPEIVYSNSGNDNFATYSIPNLVLTGRDDPGGSCGYDIYEYHDVIYTANDYGFAYRSTNGGRNFGAPWEDIDGANIYDRNLWSLWEVSGQLYAGTCVQGHAQGGTCQIRRFNGTSWISSPAVVTLATNTYGQGFIRGIQDPSNPARSYVSTGLGSYDAYNHYPDESKIYIFDGSSLTDISPPAPTPTRPVEHFGVGIQAMCFADNFGRGKTQPGKASRRLLVSTQTSFSVKADRPVAMTSARGFVVTAVTVGGQQMQNGNWLQVQSTAGFPPSGRIRVGSQAGTYSSLVAAGGVGNFPGPGFLNVQGVNGLITAGTIVELL